MRHIARASDVEYDRTLGPFGSRFTHSTNRAAVWLASIMKHFNYIIFVNFICFFPNFFIEKYINTFVWIFIIICNNIF